jgi:hypothetical protein
MPTIDRLFGLRPMSRLVIPELDELLDETPIDPVPLEGTFRGISNEAVGPVAHVRIDGHVAERCGHKRVFNLFLTLPHGGIDYSGPSGAVSWRLSFQIFNSLDQHFPSVKTPRKAR